MPQMANVTVKAANGTTDVVFVSKVAAAGDSSAARWSVDAANASRQLRPTASVQTAFNGPRTARRVNIQVSFPIVREIGGVPTQVGAFPGSFSAVVPTIATDAEANEFAAQFTNFIAATLIKEVVSVGYAPS